MSLSAGVSCEITGLVAAAQHNGKRCMLTKFHEASGRWQVMLESGTGLAVRPTNLGGTIVPPSLLNEVEESMKAAADAGDWLRILKWEGRMEELLEYQSEPVSVTILLRFVRAHLMYWGDFKEDAAGKEHGRTYVQLEERRIDLLAAMGRLRESALALCDLANNQLQIEDEKATAERFFKRALEIGAANGFTDVKCRAYQGLGGMAPPEEAVKLFRHAMSLATFVAGQDNTWYLNLLESLLHELFRTNAIEEAAPLVQRYREAAAAESLRKGGTN